MDSGFPSQEATWFHLPGIILLNMNSTRLPSYKLPSFLSLHHHSHFLRSFASILLAQSQASEGRKGCTFSEVEVHLQNMSMKARLIVCVLFASLAMASQADLDKAPLYVRLAETALKVWESSGPGKEQWNYERGVLLYGLEKVWQKTGDSKYLSYIQRRTDDFVTENGSIPTFKLADFNLDNIRSGVNLLFLYKQTGQAKYRQAAELLREQLRKQPRTNAGGFWHKQIYPFQMWLDGLFMAGPFSAEYAALFKEPQDFDDIALQLTLMEKVARDSATGLLYHGYDESRQQAWSDPATGRSPSIWGRAVGWYAMALVDTLDFFPRSHPQHGDLVAILQRLAPALAKVQDPASGVWWEVLDQGSRAGNYLESSASSMFVYALAKGVVKGYLPPQYLTVAKKGYKGIQEQFIEARDDGGVNLTKTVSVGGLGGNPYRNGTYEYYLSETVVTNDAKGVGPFLLASTLLSK